MTEIVFGWVYVPFSQQLGKCLLYWVGWEMGPVHLRIEYEHKRYNLLLRWVLPFYCRKGICHRPFSSFHHDEMMVENRREYHINLNLMVSYDVCSCYLHSNTKRFPLLARIWRRCPGSRPPRKKTHNPYYTNYRLTRKMWKKYIHNNNPLGESRCPLIQPNFFPYPMAIDGASCITIFFSTSSFWFFIDS